MITIKPALQKILKEYDTERKKKTASSRRAHGSVNSMMEADEPSRARKE